MFQRVRSHAWPERGFMLLPRRWVVERSFGWAARFLAFAMLMAYRFVQLVAYAL